MNAAVSRTSAWLKRALAAAWLLSWMPIVVVAQPLVPVPPLQARVTDLTFTLTAPEVASLEQTLRTFEERKGTQIAVLMVPTAQPEAIEQYALRVVEQWKLGRRKVDDGALLLIAKNDRAVRIEVGYGIEGALNDATAARIINETIKPRFRRGEYAAGVVAGVDQMMRVLDGEPLPAPVRRAPRSGEDDLGQVWPVLFVVALVLGRVLRRALGRLPGAVGVGSVLGIVAWFAVGTLPVAAAAGLAGFLVTLLGIGMEGHGGMYGHGGHWSAGGRGGGGGFRGGGGGFGGGGASGRW